MKQDDKEMLLQDLCSRLPYGVECKDDYAQIEGKLCQIGTNYDMCLLSDEYGDSKWALISNCKPYLYPIESMTEEATKEFNATLDWITTADGHSESVLTYESFDCLNKHHIDYRGLIPKGRAIDATNLNIYSYETRR